jgi:hypothetical protein
MVMCDFEASVPTWLAPGDQFSISVMASDRALVANRTTETLFFNLRPNPTLESVEPARGGTAGGTDVVVSGSGFLPGVRVLVDGVPLLPDGGTLVDEQTISGRMPPHEAGPATVTLQSSLGESKLVVTFSYAEPPAVSAIQPEEGDPVGGTPVKIRGQRFGQDTQVLFGDTLAEARPLAGPQLVSDTEILGAAPPGKGRTSVWVFDAALGWDRLVDGFGWSVP